jgi:hypothetical protein
MFFEGLINLQLPFILISSGISSGLYLLFLFFNIDQPNDLPASTSLDQQSFSIEITKENSNQDYIISLHEYYNQIYITAELAKPNSPLPNSKTRPPIECRSFKQPYTFQFAQASFCRPPPHC